jgi:DNA primase
MNRVAPSRHAPGAPPRFDTGELKRRRPLAEVVEGYGLELRRSGAALVARCPFHQDGGRPNLHVYPDSGVFICYRCGARGDVIGFVQRVERVDFVGACRILGGDLAPAGHAPPAAAPPPPTPIRDPEREACLELAASVYAARLPREAAPLAYCAGRGLSLAALERCRVGFAAGDELVPALRTSGLHLDAARRAGLLTGDGREFLAGRITVPEMRGARTAWMVGRLCPGVAPALGADKRFLNVRGPRRLLGFHTARGHADVFVTEGIFDYLTLATWGLPAVSLCGTQPGDRLRRGAMRALARFRRVFLVLDTDAAGRETSAALATALGNHAVPVALPGVKDVAELGAHAGGRAAFHHAARLALARAGAAGAAGAHSRAAPPSATA